MSVGHRAVIEAREDELSSLTELRELLDRAESGRAASLSVAGETVELPSSASRVLRFALEEFAAGHVLSVEPIESVVTTQEAADLLAVSRPYVVKLVEAGEIPFYKVGPRRRLRLDDVLSYREVRDARRGATLRDLSRLSQELGLE